MPKDYEIISVGWPKKDKSLKISSKLSTELKDSLIEFLKNNVNLLAWKPEHMLSTDHSIISHELNVEHNKKLVQQRKMQFSREKSMGWILEVNYPIWLSNIVLENKTG